MNFLRMYAKQIVLILLLGGFLFHAFFVRAPLDFPIQKTVVVEEGMTVKDVARLLEREEVIQSSAFFAFIVKTFGPVRGVRSGTYTFTKKLSVYAVMDRITTGVYGTPLVRVTIPEGSTVRDISIILSDTFPEFDVDTFLDIGRPLEGYLFPDTYLFVDSITPEGVVAAMQANFDKKLEPLKEDIESSGKSLEDIVVMASILEKEARLYETKQIVSGILWKRLSLDIPLQVDAVFGYILDRDTFSPTFEQLEIDSPYNTYRNKGLPPGPITNPGIESIEAALRPLDSPYLYYLTGVDGQMHYARTFDEHVANRRFLR